ncbi:hypothetical protein LSTR_LSTR011556 [Laodelphax striatellus]|uniref:ZP domain-containing protein n=1 Tax=Laodelphax striatellus TaxID=195883 RepID=A0A482XAB9_LAOST|nr:hypothetical protein LSTR_LSTR011556 [Laodelphax striatellus]
MRGGLALFINEIGIQEVWDSVRSVRCLWEGNLNKSLSVALSVGMLNQEVVTFSGDKATARLDIQMGRGPFAPLANGLVKIGEPMTLVVTVEGDPAFNVLVRECSARDNDPESGNIVKLTNDEGCILKPKLIGAFQMSRNPDTNSVISYAFFNAFKFPDIMDLTIECNIELCKTECRPCSNADQKTEPGRRRRRRRHLKKDNHHNSMMENQTGKQNKHLKSTSSPIGPLPHSMIVPRYPIQFSHHSANETKLRHIINITDFRNIIHSQPDFNSERISENSIDDLLPDIFK